MKHLLSSAVAVAIAATLAAPQADAIPIRANSGFATSSLAANDDGSTGLVSLGFSANFFGTTYTSAYINNNGNITFDSSLGTFTPFPILTTGVKLIAPFFADVDTRAGALMTYGTDTVGGQDAFGVNWIRVCFYSADCSKTNSFQLVLVDRSDIAAGDFDIEFNYENIDWETGDASGGSGGLGGSSARVGWSNGTTSFELTGSAVNGAFLDGGPNALISDELNSAFAIDATGDQIGRYLFQVRNGAIVDPPDPTVPEPGMLLLLSSGLIAVGAARRRMRS